MDADSIRQSPRCVNQVPDRHPAAPQGPDRSRVGGGDRTPCLRLPAESKVMSQGASDRQGDSSGGLPIDTPRSTTVVVGCVDVVAKSKGREPQDPMHIEDGILDDIRLKTATIPSDAVVVIRPFSSEGADLGTGQAGGKDSRVEAAKTIQADGPKLLAESFKTKLGSLGPFPQVRVDDGSEPPGNSLVVEGRFTQIDPGSRGKRYWGFGAGKSGLEVGGTVKNGKGELLAEFTQKRIVVMGEFGGSYI